MRFYDRIGAELCGAGSLRRGVEVVFVEEVAAAGNLHVAVVIAVAGCVEIFFLKLFEQVFGLSDPIDEEARLIERGRADAFEVRRTVFFYKIVEDGTHDIEPHGIVVLESVDAFFERQRRQGGLGHYRPKNRFGLNRCGSDDGIGEFLPGAGVGRDEELFAAGEADALLFAGDLDETFGHGHFCLACTSDDTKRGA